MRGFVRIHHDYSHGVLWFQFIFPKYLKASTEVWSTRQSTLSRHILFVWSVIRRHFIVVVVKWPNVWTGDKGWHMIRTLAICGQEIFITNSTLKTNIVQGFSWQIFTKISAINWNFQNISSHLEKFPRKISVPPLAWGERHGWVILFYYQ